jgi:hypothetical protein
MAGKVVYLWDRDTDARYLMNPNGDILLNADTVASTQYALLITTSVTNLANQAPAKGFRLYPNPAHHEVRLRLTGEPAYMMYNQLGKAVKQGQGTSINLDGLPAGIYTVAVAGYGHQKLVVE